MKNNFDPGEYEELSNVRNRIIKDLNKNSVLYGKKILDIGCGTGCWSSIVAKTNINSYVKGIDIVDSYVETASKRNKYDNVDYILEDYKNVNYAYDVVTMFLSLTELLKKNNFKEILLKIDKILRKNGKIVICDEFEDDYFLEKDLIGIKIMKDLGYKYLTKILFEEILKKNSYCVETTKLYKTNSATTNLVGSKIKIFFENELNKYDNSKTEESIDIWLKNKEEIQKNSGFRTNNLIRVYVIKRKEEIKESKFNFEKPTLIYDTEEIKKNIHYYKELAGSFKLKFMFPVKAFPNKEILKFFQENGFGFDVSNENEHTLIKEYNSEVMFSDPTYKLNLNNCLRININSKYIKSRFGEKISITNHEILHFHISEFKNKNVLSSIIKKLKSLNLSNVKILDIGGGYDNLTYMEIKRFITRIFDLLPNDTILYLEPGSLWFYNCGYLTSKIERITNIDNIMYVYLTASKELHAKWSNPIICNLINENNADNTYFFCGPTCYEKDIFCRVNSNVNIKKGDHILFSNIDSYSYAWNVSFNGIEKAEVDFYENGK